MGISTLCCVFALPEARLGLAVNAIVFVLACTAVRFPEGPPAVGHSGLENLWRSAPSGSGAAFDPGTVPEVGKPYLAQSIAPGTLLAASVRLRMHGEIKLGSSWQPFQAEQVIVPRRGMIWAGTVSMFGLPCAVPISSSTARGCCFGNCSTSFPSCMQKDPALRGPASAAC